MPDAGGATAIGVDIGGTNLRVARVSGAGDVLEGRSEAVARDPLELLNRIVELCRSLDTPGVAGIGLGVPGRVDSADRRVLSGGVVDLSGVALAEVVEARLGKPVVVDNDCSLALVAERAVGAAQGTKDVVMFTIGTGIGGAVVLGGRVAHGRRTAGQLGHLTVDPSGLRCACGRRGCVETTSSGTALRRLMADAGLPDTTLAQALFDLEAAGDARATRVLDAWAAPLRSAIDSIVAALDPELVVLGGGLGGFAVRALGRAPALSPWYECAVVGARLGDEAGAIGAGLAALAAALPARPAAPVLAPASMGLPG